MLPMLRRVIIAFIRRFWLSSRTPWPRIALPLRILRKNRKPRPSLSRPSCFTTPLPRRSLAMRTSTRRSTLTGMCWLLMVISRPTATVMAIATLLISTASTESTVDTIKMQQRRMTRIRSQKRKWSRTSKLTSSSSPRRATKTNKSLRNNRSQFPQPKLTKNKIRRSMPLRRRVLQRSWTKIRLLNQTRKVRMGTKLNMKMVPKTWRWINRRIFKKIKERGLRWKMIHRIRLRIRWLNEL